MADAPSTPEPSRIRFGNIFADIVTFDGALRRIVERAKSGEGGYVVTPNVDHVCMAEEDKRLVAAYNDAFLSLTDGMPLVWLSRLMKVRVPQKISGSDLIAPLIAAAAKEKLPVFFLGGMPGVAQEAALRLQKEHPGLIIAGHDAPPLGFDTDPVRNAQVVERVRSSGARIVLVALGAPKQELWMHANRDALRPVVALGIGASLDFIAGVVRRAPEWMSRSGFEWLYRLVQEPGRMASRYLVRDRAIFGITIRMLRLPLAQRTLQAPKVR